MSTRINGSKKTEMNTFQSDDFEGALIHAAASSTSSVDHRVQTLSLNIMESYGDNPEQPNLLVKKACAFGYQGNDTEGATAYLERLYKSIPALLNIYPEYGVKKPTGSIKELEDVLKMLSMIPYTTLAEMFVKILKNSFEGAHVCRIANTDLFPLLEFFVKVMDDKNLRGNLPVQAEGFFDDLFDHFLKKTFYKEYTSIVRCYSRFFDINQKICGNTLLGRTVSYDRSFSVLKPNQIHLATLLLDNGANPGVCHRRQYQDDVENTALQTAVYAGDENLIRLLATRGNIDGENFDGDTALHFAAACNPENAAYLLLDLGASPNTKNKNGDTPLTIAARRGKTALVKKMIENGGDKTIKNKAGYTPADYLQQAVASRLQTTTYELQTMAAALAPSATKQQETIERQAKEIADLKAQVEKLTLENAQLQAQIAKK